MTDLDKLYAEAWDRICKEAGPMSEPTRRRLIDLTQRREPKRPALRTAA